MELVPFSVSPSNYGQLRISCYLYTEKSSYFGSRLWQQDCAGSQQPPPDINIFTLSSWRHQRHGTLIRDESPASSSLPCGHRLDSADIASTDYQRLDPDAKKDLKICTT